jgi:hypothetical protein
VQSNTSAAGAGGSSSQSSISCSLNEAMVTPGITADIYIHNANGGATQKGINYTAGYLLGVGGSPRVMTGNAGNTSTGNITGISVSFSSGNISVGQIKIYGRL